MIPAFFATGPSVHEMETQRRATASLKPIFKLDERFSRQDSFSQTPFGVQRTISLARFVRSSPLELSVNDSLRGIRSVRLPEALNERFNRLDSFTQARFCSQRTICPLEFVRSNLQWLSVNDFPTPVRSLKLPEGLSEHPPHPHPQSTHYSETSAEQTERPENPQLESGFQNFIKNIWKYSVF